MRKWQVLDIFWKAAAASLGKITDIERCLDIVPSLQTKNGSGEALLADFEVSEGIYIYDLASNILVWYVYGWEPMLHWSIHAKRPQLFHKRT
ncbi:hypothetical protein BT93_L0177 [Corymbia citriodora subsp. variegata]|uniref:Uncharacterized protein n=1 Tax=Corymbia citriodora subsp. variegata TaxID=360336 RepID=A0A8T0CQE2_CORYI|nr:hypothetical protein BT93_L0177 [Corymbia citriodora subsp. variegata]